MERMEKEERKDVTSGFRKYGILWSESKANQEPHTAETETGRSETLNHTMNPALPQIWSVSFSQFKAEFWLPGDDRVPSP